MPQERPTPALRAVLTAALVVFGAAAGFFVSEVAYRALLYVEQPARFVQSQRDMRHPSVWFFHASPWHYSEPFGYEYAKETVHGGSAQDGTVRSCWTFPLNAMGNVGLVEGDYGAANRKILVFGDSFTAQPHDQLTWPHLLQRRLNADARPVTAVMNMARDGYGILQMLDLAASKIAEHKPHIAVIAFITDDLTRARSWRTAVVVDGRERILTTDEPNPRPSPERSADTAVWNSKATPAWCAQAVATQRRDDPILAEMEDVARNAMARSQHRTSLYTVRQSLLYDLVVHGTPFHTSLARATPLQNPRHAMASFEEDARFLAAAAAIKNSGSTVFLVHLATIEELRQGREYGAGEREAGLVASLSAALGVPVIETLAHAPPLPADIASLANTPPDIHPSPAGLAFYAEMVDRALERHGTLRRP
jgi:lysophospholipase L1-like esterase